MYHIYSCYYVALVLEVAMHLRMTCYLWTNYIVQVKILGTI